MMNESLVFSLFVASLWRPVVLAMAALLIAWILRLRHPAPQHALWTAVLAGMLLVAPASLWMPRWELALLPADQDTPPSSTTIAEIPLPASDSYRPSIPPTTGNQHPVVTTAASTPDPGSTDPQPIPAEPPIHGFTLVSILLICYLTGALILLAYWTTGWYLLRGIRRRSIPTGFALLRQSADIVAPVTTGLVHRSVLLPADWREWPRDMRHAALTHEIAHIRRADTWTMLMSRCVRCLLWFHPLAWMVARKVQLLAEIACDAAALRSITDPARYSHVLLAFAEKVNRQHRPAQMAGLSMAAEKDLSRRIHSIFRLADSEPLALRRPARVAALLGIPALCFAAGVEVGKQPAMAPPGSNAGLAGALQSRSGSGLANSPTNEELILLAQAPPPPPPPGLIPTPGPGQPPPLSPEELAKAARIEGMVVSSTGGPVAEVQLRLVTIDPRGTANGEAAYSAVSKEDGSFIIDNIRAPVSGLALTATKTGYSRARYGARTSQSAVVTFALRESETRTGMVLTMVPQGVISGVITDDNDDPIQNASVLALEWAYQRGKRVLAPVSAGRSNDLGEFRIPNLLPSRYLLVANIDTQNAGNEITIPTFFPNGIDPQSAAPIEVFAGQEVRGMDIQLRQAKGYTVSGRLIGVNAEEMTRMIVLPEAMANGDAGIMTYALRAATVNPDGTFSIAGVQPGSYVLDTMIGQQGIPPHGAGRFPVTIRDADVTNLELTLGAGITLTGTVRMESGEYADLLSRQNSTIAGFQANPAGGLGVRLVLSKGVQVASVPGAQVERDGTFKIEYLSPGIYELERSNVAGTYIKSVRLNGVLVGRNALNIDANGTLEITLGKDAPTVAGVVLNEAGEIQRGAMAGIWPVQADNSAIYGGTRFAATDASGAFRIESVTPGTYYVLAFEDVSGDLAVAREFLDQFRAKAARVEVKDGGSISVMPDFIPLTQIEKAAASLVY